MRSRTRPPTPLLGPALLLALASPLPPGLTLGAARAAPPPAALTLSDALATARAQHPALVAARAAIDEAQAQVLGARVTFPDNPEVTAEGGPRVGSPSPRGGGISAELDLSLEQRLETGGQRGHRLGRARAGVAVSRARVDELRRQVEAQVARAFYRLLAANERVDLLNQHQDLARTVWRLAVARLRSGDATQLDVNAARLGLAEATRRVLAARGRRGALRLELARLLGLTGPDAGPGAVPDTVPDTGPDAGAVDDPDRLASGAGSAPALAVVGSLPGPAALPAPGSPLVAEVLARAVEIRLALAGFPAALRQTRAEIRLADAEASPDLGVGLRYSHDDSGEGVLASVRVELPVFQRNQGARAQARAKRRRLEAQARGLLLQVRAEVQRALLVYASARAAVDLYDGEVLQAQGESLGLVDKALAAGSTGVAELLSIQRELLAGREGYLSARLTLAEAQAELLAALGLPQSADPRAALQARAEETTAPRPEGASGPEAPAPPSAPKPLHPADPTTDPTTEAPRGESR